jgi:hypothetical protein
MIKFFCNQLKKKQIQTAKKLSEMRGLAFSLKKDQESTGLRIFRCAENMQDWLDNNVFHIFYFERDGYGGVIENHGCECMHEINIKEEGLPEHFIGHELDTKLCYWDSLKFVSDEPKVQSIMEPYRVDSYKDLRAGMFYISLMVDTKTGTLVTDKYYMGLLLHPQNNQETHEDVFTPLPQTPSTGDHKPERLSIDPGIGLTWQELSGVDQACLTLIGPHVQSLPHLTTGNGLRPIHELIGVEGFSSQALSEEHLIAVRANITISM